MLGKSNAITSSGGGSGKTKILVFEKTVSGSGRFDQTLVFTESMNNVEAGNSYLIEITADRDIIYGQGAVLMMCAMYYFKGESSNTIDYANGVYRSSDYYSFMGFMQLAKINNNITISSDNHGYFNTDRNYTLKIYKMVV